MVTDVFSNNVMIDRESSRNANLWLAYQALTNAASEDIPGDLNDRILKLSEELSKLIDESTFKLDGLVGYNINWLREMDRQ